MRKPYFYNTGTHTLHYTGYCCQSKFKAPPDNVLFFDNEDEVLACDGRAVSVCKNCMRNRDKNKKKW